MLTGATNPWSFGVGLHTRGANGVFYIDVVRSHLMTRPLTACLRCLCVRDREREVVELISRGHNNAAIAQDLYISDKTLRQ